MTDFTSIQSPPHLPHAASPRSGWRARWVGICGLVPAMTLLAGAQCQTGDSPDAGPTDDQCDVDLLYSADTAQGIGLDEDVGGTLCPARDVDWFRFTVASAGSVVQIHLRMDTELSPVEPSYTIVTAADLPTGHSAFDATRTPGEVVDFIGVHRMDEAGDYIIKVTDLEGFDDRFDISNAYTLTVSVAPDPDTNEPNDVADAATPLTPGTALTGLIGTTGDEDWYAVSVPDDAQILDATVRVPSASGLSLGVEVIGPSPLTVVDRRTGVDDGIDTIEARSRAFVRGGPDLTFFVRVFDTTGNVAQPDDAIGRYELNVTLLDDPDVQEAAPGNETPFAPVLADHNTSFTGSIATHGDEDVYRLPPVPATFEDPRVLVVHFESTREADVDFQPQIRVLTFNPEADNFAACTEEEGCPSDAVTNEPFICLPTGATPNCGRVYMQRVITSGSSLDIGFPLRQNRPSYVVVNEFADDGFMENDSYTISFEIIDDPDEGEGDDFIIPNLQVATYDNDAELNQQFNQSLDRARIVSASPPIPPPCPEPELGADGGLVFPPTCDTADGGVSDPDCEDPVPGCLPLEKVPAPGPGGQVPYAVACSGQTYNLHLEGNLSYDGDRDFFRVDVPEAGYWGLHVTYDVSVTTPVELTVFVHADNTLIGAWLDAQQTSTGCDSSADCDPGSTCIDDKCWADIDANPAFNDHVFPGEDQCLFLHVNDERPVFIEVADNGINDFDTEMRYTIDIVQSCGCPDNCDGPNNSCQGVAAP